MMLNTRLTRLERLHGTQNGGDLRLTPEELRRIDTPALEELVAIARRARAANYYDPKDRARAAEIVRKVRETERRVQRP